VLAIIGGAVVAALLTIAGVGGLSAGARNPSPYTTRLAGPYGNPNFLAFAIGFAVPAGIAALGVWTGRARIVLGLAVAVVAAVLLLTFSRGGLLAAAAGAVLVLVLGQRRGSRRQWLTIAALLAVGAVSALAYPTFVEQRRHATDSALKMRLRALDRSGWDAGRQGLIPGAATEMRNPTRDVLEVRADGPGRGVSRALGRARRGDSYELHFQARAVGAPRELRFGIEDNLLGNGAVAAAATFGRGWQNATVRWEAPAESPNLRMYVWTAAAGPAFQIRDVRTVARRFGGPPVTRTISPELTGNRFAELTAQLARIDARDIRSREVGVDLSWRAFRSAPVRGIGWGRFPEYSTAHSVFRDLPTHNEYLRFLAELGLVGTGLLALSGLIVAASFWRRRLDPVGLALLGMLVTGAAGLVFVNALEAPAAAAPLGLAAALACARPARREHPIADEAPELWSVGFGGAANWAQRWSGGASGLGGAVSARGALDVLGRLRAAAPLPASSGQGAVVARASGAAPWPAPREAGGPAPALVDRVAHLRAAAPVVPPAGWQRWLRQSERRLRRAARRGVRVLRALGGHALAGGGAVPVAIGSRAAWASAIGALALLPRIPLMFERHEIVSGGESQQYVALAHRFFDQGAASAVRPPGYPLFLMLSGLLPGRLEAAAIVVQLIAGAALCAALVFFAWPLFGRLASICAGLLLALTAPFISIESQLLADMLFGLLATVAAALLAAAALDERDRWRLRWLLASGLVIGCATYVTPVGHALVLAPLLPLALATRSWRATLTGGAIVLAVVALLTVPWMLRNDARYGSFTMSTRDAATHGTAPRDPLGFAHKVFDDAADGKGIGEVTLTQVNSAPLPVLTRVGLRVGSVLRAVWLVFALAGLAAALWLTSRSARTRVAAGAALGVWMAIAVATAALHGGHVRYAASLAPLTFLLGAAGLTVAVKVAVQLLGVGCGTPCPSLPGLVRNAATPTDSDHPQVGSPPR
jgi:hypothetical protein